MAEQTDTINFWRRSKHGSFPRPAILETEGRSGAKIPPASGDLPKLNTIEMLGLLDDIGSHDDFQTQIRNVLFTRFGNDAGRSETLTE